MRPTSSQAVQIRVSWLVLIFTELSLISHLNINKVTLQSWRKIETEILPMDFSGRLRESLINFDGF